jgi:hypothetical protein
MGDSVAIFQLDVPEQYLTRLKTDRRALFLTALALRDDDQTIIQIDVLVMGTKEFVYAETAVKSAAGAEEDPRAIKVPWIERK